MTPLPSLPSVRPRILSVCMLCKRQIERLVNASIHELVFTYQYVEQAPNGEISPEEYEPALDCLCTVGLNVERLQQMLLAAQKGEA